MFAAVLFVDIVGATQMLERAEKPLAWLNDFHRAVGDQVILHGGKIENYTGDGMKAYFLGKSLLLDACLAANAIRDCVPVCVRQALHAGDAIAGAIGHPSLIYNQVLGPPCYVASGLMKFAKSREILVTDPLGKETVEIKGASYRISRL